MESDADYGCCCIILLLQLQLVVVVSDGCVDKAKISFLHGGTFLKTKIIKWILGYKIIDNLA